MRRTHCRPRNITTPRIRAFSAVAAALALLVAPLDARAQGESSAISLAIGPGSHGLNGKLDFEFGPKRPGSSSRLYLDVGGAGWSFDNPTFILNGISYSSNVTILAIGVGVTQEFVLSEKFVVSPFAGLRGEFVRFSDGDLVSRIGDSGLDRLQGGITVGQRVENAYGEAMTFDLGTRVGFRFSNHVELSGTIGFSPIKFETASTLFGEYWGEAPYPNEYHVHRASMRLEVGLRFHGKPRA